MEQYDDGNIIWNIFVSVTIWHLLKWSCSQKDIKAFSPTSNKTFSSKHIWIRGKQTFTFYYNTTLGFSTCFGLLGFTNAQQTSTVSGTTQYLTSNQLVNLAPVRCICVYTTLHTGSLTSLNQNNQNILCSIPVETAPFTMIGYKNMNGYKANLNNNVFNSITLKLTDQAGNLLNLNGINWSMTIQLDVVDYGLD